MNQWAKSAWGGAAKKELVYKKQKLVVYFRSYTSGVATSEPYVFIEKNGHWVCLLSAMLCECEMDASIEGDALVLWRLDFANGKGPGLKSSGKPKRTEYVRFNLRNLMRD